jgi:hypothetical protein
MKLALNHNKMLPINTTPENALEVGFYKIVEIYYNRALVEFKPKFDPSIKGQEFNIDLTPIEKTPPVGQDFVQLTTLKSKIIHVINVTWVPTTQSDIDDCNLVIEWEIINRAKYDVLIAQMPVLNEPLKKLSLAELNSLSTPQFMDKLKADPRNQLPTGQEVWDNEQFEDDYSSLLTKS